jgi:hypothetical protein
VYCDSGARLLTREDSDTSRVLHLQILPPCRVGLRSTTCPTASDPASLQGGLQSDVCYTAPYPASLSERLQSVVCPTALAPVVSCGSRVLSIKKNQVGLSVQLDVHVSNTRTPVPKALGVRAIISLQDVRTDNTISACKTCEQAATVWLNSAAPRG